MKKFVLIFLGFLLINNAYCFGQDSLLDVDNELLNHFLKQNSYYTGFINTPNDENYICKELVRYTPNTDKDSNILIMVNSDIYQDIKQEIQTYAEDIHCIYGYGIYITNVTKGSPEQIKKTITSYKKNLRGVFFVGNITEAFFEISNDHNKYNYRKWPCDLFFMDLDGEWTDSDSNNIYDIHNGKVSPEIFLYRLNTKGMNNLDEVAAYKRHFFKIHNFFWNSHYQNAKSSLRYTNEDWINSNTINCREFLDISGRNNTDSYKATIDPSFSKSDYLTRISGNRYRITQLAAHSSPILHRFNEEIMQVEELTDLYSSNIAYNLFCCSACNWTYKTDAYIGGAYLFGNNKTLCVLGSTKTGSMLGFEHFYNPLNEGLNIGDSFLNWWQKYCGNEHGQSEISWFYGLSLLGDACINMRHDVQNFCTRDLLLKRYPFDNSSNLILYKAERSIYVTKDFKIPQNVHVIFDAPQITFEQGFTLSNGASIETREEGCIL